MSVEAESNRTGDEGKLPNHYTYINITTTSPTTLLHRGDRLFSRTDGRLESIKTSDENCKVSIEIYRESSDDYRLFRPFQDAIAEFLGVGFIPGCNRHVSDTEDARTKPCGGRGS